MQNIENLKRFIWFSGRANRKEYLLANIPGLFITLAMYWVVLTASTFDGIPDIFWLLLILVLPAGYLALTAAVRRLHDLGMSWVSIILFLVPVIGFLAALYLFIKSGDAFTNDYGPAPDWP